MNQDWEIKSRSHQCTATGRSFTEGEFFYTLLFREKTGFRREDLSEEAWNNRNDNIQPFSFWKTKYEPPPPPKPETFKADDAEGLLRHLLEDNNPESHHARYILAAMLERKKALRPMPSSEAGILIYEHVASGEVWAIEDPGLTMEQIPEVQRKVSEMLSGFGFR
jgi:hypothetical protein